MFLKNAGDVRNIPFIYCFSNAVSSVFCEPRHNVEVTSSPNYRNLVRM